MSRRARPSRTGHSRTGYSRTGPAAVPTPEAALMLDLTAALLAAGTGLVRALEVLAGHLPGAAGLKPVVAGLRLGLDWETAWQPAAEDPELAELGRRLAPLHGTGIAGARHLRQAADQLRRDRRRSAEQAAAELSVGLVLPLGLCQLPAFICLGIVPLAIALWPA